MEFSLSSSFATVAHPTGAHDLSLLRNIPNEVFSRIFVLTCDRPVQVKLLAANKTNISSPCQAVVLLQVCSKWHQVALSIGTLWSRVEISFQDIHQNFTQCLFHYQTWIERAGTYSLTVTIRQVDKVSVDTVRNVFHNFVVPYRIQLANV
jgi:hypothetical protein